MANRGIVETNCRSKVLYFFAKPKNTNNPKINTIEYGRKPLNEGKIPNMNGNSTKINTKSTPHTQPLLGKILLSKKKNDTSTNMEIGKVSAKLVRRFGMLCQSILPTPVSTKINGNSKIVRFLTR